MTWQTSCCYISVALLFCVWLESTQKEKNYRHARCVHAKSRAWKLWTEGNFPKLKKNQICKKEVRRILGGWNKLLEKLYLFKYQYNDIVVRIFHASLEKFEAIRHVDSLVLFVIFILATLNIPFQLTRTYLFQNADNIYPHSSACWLKRFVCTEYNWGLVRQKKMCIRKKEKNRQTKQQEGKNRQ